MHSTLLCINVKLPPSVSQVVETQEDSDNVMHLIQPLPLIRAVQSYP